jgi:peptidase M15-like protein
MTDDDYPESDPHGHGYFQPSEFLCRCGRADCDARTEVHPDLLARLNLLRMRVGRPVIVTSGLRCRYWNDKQGGVKDSGHLTGEEADLRAANSHERWELLAANFEGKTPLFSRLGIGRDFLHVGVSTMHVNEVIWTYYNQRKETTT